MPIDTSLAVTATEQGMRESRIRHAMDHFLYRLKKHIGVYPLLQSDVLPDHEVVWMGGVDGGPSQEVVSAMKRFPVLWLHALPDDVCIVPRRMIDEYAGGPAADWMRSIGVVLVENQAARLEYEEREKYHR